MERIKRKQAQYLLSDPLIANMEIDIQDLFYRMLSVLEHTFPDIPDTFFNGRKELFRQTQVVCFDHSDDMPVSIDLYIGQAYLISQSVKRNNQTIDFVPVFIDGEWRQISPVIVLEKNAALYTVIHELCHLLSIGPYIQQGQQVNHKYGLLFYEYVIISDSLEQKKRSGDYITNEMVTNMAADFFINYISSSGQQEKSIDYDMLLNYLIHM